MKFLAESDRLGLVVMDEQHVEGAKHFWGDPDVMAESGGASKLENLPAIILAYRQCYEATGITVFGVIEKHSGQLIGASGFNGTANDKKIELIYHFAAAFWGKGYATEAGALALKLAQKQNGIHLVYASADPQNKASLKVLEKLGFHYIDHRWFDDTQQEEPYYELVLHQN